MNKLFLLIIAFFVQGCFLFVPRQEVVVDKKIIPNQCPKFDYIISLNIKRPNDKIDSEWFCIKRNELLTEMTKYKKAKSIFNKNIEKMNEPIILKGQSYSEKIKRIEKIIYVKHQCPKFNYTISLNIKSPNDKIDSEWFCIKRNELLTEMTKYKKAKSIFNKNIEKINETK
jgi:hypothetical protein